MNILFVPHRDSERNSIQPLAAALNNLGHSCQISGAFPDHRNPDIVHEWTEAAPTIYPCPRIVHKTDSTSVPAEGYTYSDPLLAAQIPPGKPCLELLPVSDPELFFLRPLPRTDGRILGITPATTVLVYTGNVHQRNAHQIRGLYLAVAILQREGHPTILVRTGADSFNFLGPDVSWTRGLSIELGVVDRAQLPAILSLADLFVIPSQSFPAKLSECLAIGRPVILPRHEGMIHDRDACLLEKADGRHIAAAIRRIMSDRELYLRLAEGAVQFSQMRLNPRQAAERLAVFYRRFQP